MKKSGFCFSLSGKIQEIFILDTYNKMIESAQKEGLSASVIEALKQAKKQAKKPTPNPIVSPEMEAAIRRIVADEMKSKTPVARGNVKLNDLLPKIDELLEFVKADSAIHMKKGGFGITH